MYEAQASISLFFVLASFECWQKGINRRKDSIFSAADIKCVFILASGGPALAATPATSSSQEVFRCPHPSVPLLQPLHVSLAVAPEAAPIATVAEYRSPSLRDRPPSRGRVAVCACTMVFNAAKFLLEWVAYHAGIGVEHFFLYDNASEDELASDPWGSTWWSGPGPGPRPRRRVKPSSSQAASHCPKDQYFRVLSKHPDPRIQIVDQIANPRSIGILWILDCSSQVLLAAMSKFEIQI